MRLFSCRFKKTAFDLVVWHDGLLYNLLQVNVGGFFYNLIISLYLNSTCSMKIGKKKTTKIKKTLSIQKRCTSRLYFKSVTI